MAKKVWSTALSVVICGLLLPYIVHSNAVGARYSSAPSNSTTNWSNTSNTTFSPVPHCVFGLEPCSLTILGNIQLIIFFGIILGVAAKLISDGAELLLDLGLPAAIIGGIVLPLLGAVPDSAMIIASGSSGDPAEADSQIAVGMGTLAGSTIMLLTIPWFGGILLGRVDIVNGQGVDGRCSKFKLSSLWKQGVTVTPDVTYSAIIMIVTALPYLLIQGADWHYGPTTKMDLINHKPPKYIKYTAIVTSVICFMSFLAYLVYLVVFSVASKRREELRRQERLKRQVVKNMIMSLQASRLTVRPKETAVVGETGEAKPLLGDNNTGLQKKYFSAWKVHKKADPVEEPDEGTDSEKVEKRVSPTTTIQENQSTDHIEEEAEEPKWKILVKSITFLVVGVGLVTVFSDPMVDSLTNLVNKDNKGIFYVDDNGKKHQGQALPIPVFYLSFIITPLCSNASELVSSLIFASKKKKVNSSMTFSQLYGAATMNNTLCLGIFAFLVAFRGLTWQYSAEVTVILLVQFIMGGVALCSGFLNKHTYLLLLAIPVVLIYFLSIVLVWLLEHFLHWK